MVKTMLSIHGKKIHRLAKSRCKGKAPAKSYGKGFILTQHIDVNVISYTDGTWLHWVSECGL